MIGDAYEKAFGKFPTNEVATPGEVLEGVASGTRAGYRIFEMVTGEHYMTVVAPSGWTDEKRQLYLHDYLSYVMEQTGQDYVFVHEPLAEAEALELLNTLQRQGQI
jgi:hypothetical protein